MNLSQLFSRQNRKFNITVLVVVVLYFILQNQVTHLRPDHAFLGLLIISLAFLGKEKARRFLIDWAPFILFLIAYDMMRGVADSIRGVIHVQEPYQWEHWLFAKFFSGEIPAFYLQRVQYELGDSILRKFLDIMGANFYTLHFTIPLLVGWVLWHTTNDRKMFYRFAYTLTVLNVMALITFMLYPAAPPWYVYYYGFVQPAHTSFWGLSAGSLINVDRLLGVHIFSTIWDSFNPNHFAAIPSLHGAYPIVAALFLYRKFRRYPVILIIYPLLVWFSAVYLNQHYIIDLIIGGAYLLVAYGIVEYFLYPKLFTRFLEKKTIPINTNTVLLTEK
ncbi:hypothetical protein DRQ12_01350 [candidate division KSB1 bacterium]|nr:MAG: hypothetical protein DRQ12_01350 [candidate division KSB1 bacterium]